MISKLLPVIIMLSKSDNLKSLKQNGKKGYSIDKS